MSQEQDRAILTLTAAQSNALCESFDQPLTRNLSLYRKTCWVSKRGNTYGANIIQVLVRMGLMEVKDRVAVPTTQGLMLMYQHGALDERDFARVA